MNLGRAETLGDASGIEGERATTRPVLGGLRLPIRAELFETLAAAEPVWRQLEERAVLTPYQRFDWIAALLGAQENSRARVSIIAFHDHTGPVALLPLEVTQRFCARSARIIGWDIGNADWMIATAEFIDRLDAPLIDVMVAEIGRLTRADLLMLHSQPGEWNGVANPLLALPHQPSPDHFYAAPLDAARLTSKRVRNIERGRRRLEETIGPVRLVRAETTADIEKLHAAFLQQRDVRFREMGVANVFAEPMFQRFFVAATEQGIGQPRPVLAMHALIAGDEILATSIGTYGGSHYSQYINSTVDGPAAKYSLMGILMYLLADELRAEGISTIDMGLGDFAYKLDWTDQHTSYDAVVPLTTAGEIIGAVLLLARRVKRAIKQTPWLWRIATKVRSAINRR